MTDSVEDLVRLIPQWVAATQGVERLSGEPQMGGDLDKRVRDLLASTTEGQDAFLTDEALGTVTAITRDLLSLKGSARTLDRFYSVVRFVETARWPPDTFGERAEVLCQLSLAAWRICRRLSRFDEAHHWLSVHDQHFAEPSTAKECSRADLESLAASESARDPHERTVEELFAFAALAREWRDTEPLRAKDLASALYGHLSKRSVPDSEADVVTYLRGDLALSIGVACRLLGKWRESEAWFTSAERRFSNSGDAELSLAMVSYGRLGLEYDRDNYRAAYAGFRRLGALFQLHGATFDRLKCETASGISLKSLGEVEQAHLVLSQLLLEPDLARHPCEPFVLVNLAETAVKIGKLEDARSYLQRACASLARRPRPMVSGFAKIVIGDILRKEGFLKEAVEVFREGVKDFAKVGAPAWVGYQRLILADTLIALGRSEEGELEILAALPSIEELELIPQGLAAVALLRESVRRRKPDPQALRELRELLQKRR